MRAFPQFLLAGATAGALLAAAGTEVAAEPEGDDAGSGAGVFEKGVVEVQPADVPFDLVRVENTLGDVRIEGHDGDEIIIHTFKRGPNDAALDRLKVSLVPDPAGPIRIDTRLETGKESQPLPAGSVRIDLLIRAPRTAAVEAEVWKGKLQVAHMENGAELRANQGELAVEHCSGRIVAHTARAKQVFREIVGDIDAQGIIGDMDLRVVRGQRLDAMVHEGSVIGRAIRSRQVTIGVMKGSVSFHGAVMPGGSYRVAVYSGNVEVKLLESTPLAIRARARKGVVDLPAALKPATARDGWVTGQHQSAKSPADMQLATHVGNISVVF